MPKTFLVRKFLHEQKQLLEEQQRQSSVLLHIDSPEPSSRLCIDLSPRHEEDKRRTVISSPSPDEDDQPLSLTVHDRNGDGSNKVTSSMSPTAREHAIRSTELENRPAYLPVSVIQSVPQTLPKFSEDAPLDCHVPRVARTTATYDNIEHPGNANPVSPTPGSPYRSYDEINNKKPRLSPSHHPSYPPVHSSRHFSPQSPPETSRLHVISPVYGPPHSPVQAKYKYINSPQSPPQTAIIQSFSPPPEIIQNTDAFESTKRPRSPSPCFRHKKHCAPNKAPRISSPTINSNTIISEKNVLIRQALASPPVAPVSQIIEKAIEAGSSVIGLTQNCIPDNQLQYCAPSKPQQVRSPLNVLSPNDMAAKTAFQPQDQHVTTTSPSSKESNNCPVVPMRMSNLQQRLGLPEDVQIEFVNGGHGIKNPLVNQVQADIVTPYSQKPIDHNETGEKNDSDQFVCKVCSKTFNLQRLLNRHMKCHSDIKRYLCTFCGKGFNDTFDLKRHTRTHTGVRPYKCNMCEKSFTQRCSLESHTLKVHGMKHNYAHKERRHKVYVCEECGHTTNEPEIHFIHLKEKHPYSPALLKFYDKRHFKFTNSTFPTLLLQGRA